MKTSFRWRAGFRLRGDVREIGKRLKVLEETKGRLQPSVIVDDARHKSSPLHGLFEWDDSKAAEAHRLEQARYLIRSVEVVYVDDQGKTSFSNSYLHVPQEDRSYIATSVVYTTPDLREKFLARALSEVDSWQRRYAKYTELADIFDAIAATKRKIKKRKAG